MKILILGGTGFLGPHTVRAALERGHTMTLFNRGKTNSHLFPDLEKLKGDRDGNLEALKGRDWDAVIDTSAYFPRIVKDSCTLLKDHCKQYVFISSISVYKSFDVDEITEESPVGTLEDPTVEKITGLTYGPLKAYCEAKAEEIMPGRVTNIRPGLIVGPGDPTDRFTYWPVRVARGGEVLCPGNPDTGVQFVDARDLGDWIIQTIEDGHAGVYNAVGPASKLTFQELVHGCKVVSGSDATFTWVDEDFLKQNMVGPWMELPLWVPGKESRGMLNSSSRRAMEHGLTFRPTADVIRDTLEWHNKERGEEHKWRAALKPEKETRVLKAWHERGEEAPAEAGATTEEKEGSGG